MINMITRKDANYKMMRRCCNKCDKMYEPTGRFQKICDDCYKESMKQANIKRRKYKDTEIVTAKCRVCGRDFQKYSEFKKNRRIRTGIRSYRAVNCSHKCSLKYIVLKNTKTYRNTKI